jgi:hypothetical protein
MPNQEEKNCQLIHSYLSALGAGAVGDELARFFTSDAIQMSVTNNCR